VYYHWYTNDTNGTALIDATDGIYGYYTSNIIYIGAFIYPAYTNALRMQEKGTQK
jgi:hypothetical protein